jgi:hypothetical protein
VVFKKVFTVSGTFKLNLKLRFLFEIKLRLCPSPSLPQWMVLKVPGPGLTGSTGYLLLLVVECQCPSKLNPRTPRQSEREAPSPSRRGTGGSMPLSGCQCQWSES